MSSDDPFQSAQWAAVLRLCSASEPFFKRNRSAPTEARVLRFLLQEEAFPRSALHCMDRSRNFLQRIEKVARRASMPSTKRARALATSIKRESFTEPRGPALHGALTELIAATAALSDEITHDYFSPTRS